MDAIFIGGFHFLNGGLVLVIQHKLCIVFPLFNQCPPFKYLFSVFLYLRKPMVRNRYGGER